MGAACAVPAIAAGGPPKVRLAAIGTGGRGHGDLHSFLRTGLAEITCACDVYAPALEWVRKEQPKAKIYRDYRQMLRECAGEYDAVSIMTPDHTHAVAFFEANKYNVPVYCAKPLGHTISETLAMMRVAREKRIITHVSHHGNSEPGTPLLPPKKYPRYKNHWAEFLQAVQQKRAANTPFELAGKFTVMGLMGTISTRFPGRRLEFDSASMRFTNVPEANALLRPDWSEAARAEWGRYL